MQFTGTELVQKRAFYTQNLNFGFAFDCYVDNTSSRYDFGISGTTGLLLNFTLQSGQMSLNNTFIHSYQPYERFYLEAQVSSGAYNVLKNGQPLIYGASQPSGDFSYFYVKRSLPGLFADWDMYVSGQNLPNLTLDSVGYLLTTGQTGVTGLLHNNGSYPLRVFSSTATNVQELGFVPLSATIGGGAASGYSLTDPAHFTSFDFTQPVLVDMATSFGDMNVLFSIVDARSQNFFVFLQPISNWSFNAQNVVTRNVAYTNYSGGFETNGFNTSLSIGLSYVSGSGQFIEPNFRPVARYSLTGVGSFAQQGFLTGATSGVTGDSNGLSGFYLISISQFAWATGVVSGLFSGVGTGIGTGLGYTGLAVGTFTGIATGFIFNGSGTLFVSGPQIGIASSGSSVSYSSYTNATGYVNITGLQKGDYFYVGVQSIALTKGVQFVNETGLVRYFSGAPQHEVSSYYDGSVVQLVALASGTAGNGVFVRSGNCQAGFFTATPFLTGGTNNGTTGSALIPIGPFTGSLSLVITGSGTYATPISGLGTGTFVYTKTFTGDWDVRTGLTVNSLVSLKGAGQYSPTLISGSGNFPPNSFITVQVSHVANPFSTDAALLVISGNNVLNPISQVLVN